MQRKAEDINVPTPSPSYLGSLHCVLVAVLQANQRTGNVIGETLLSVSGYSYIIAEISKRRLLFSYHGNNVFYFQFDSDLRMHSVQ